MASTSLFHNHGPNRKASMNHSTVTQAVILLLNDHILKVVVNYGQILLMLVANPDIFITQLFAVFSVHICEKLKQSCSLF